MCKHEERKEQQRESEVREVSRGTGGAKAEINREGCWSPPPRGVLKLNTDGSSRGNPSHAGNVQFIFSVYKGLRTKNSMEALVILYVVERRCHLGWRRIICDSNSQVVVNLLNKWTLDDVSWHLASVVKQILNLCASLDSITFNHIPREWDRVADCLAKWASDHMQNWNIVDRGQLPLDLSQKLDHLVELGKAM
ncbi:uncharacterized protein LOC131858265 [Cryptomeria japonica]|uniref:uncharacterized protein LOC131858265 n=1 Tax=Cryptomeria japonica TaxID=3369 RepID=UPI0027DA1BAC|nr:uncharacterized protein LOC131858265 [Cryptomeria japonica]